MEIIFWTSVLLILHTYLLYPLFLLLAGTISQVKGDLLFITGSRERRRAEISLPELPTISMLIAAHNEEKVIETKIKNCLELEYPREKLEFLIGSDASTDSTNDLVKSYESFGVKLIEFKERSGKAGVINKLVPLAKGDILIFSDANTMIEPFALKGLTKHFRDNKVGAVCGHLILIDRRGSPSAERIYWNYENMLKLMEGRLGASLGANGGIYALRRELFQPIPQNSLVDDFLVTMRVIERGRKIVYDPEAKAIEEVGKTVAAEFKRRVRIGAGNFQNLVHLRGLLHPRYGLVSFSFWSHKVIRWHVPFLMIAAYLSNLFLIRQGTIFFTLFYLQTTFYLLALLSQFNISKNLLFRGPQYFLFMNAALLAGFFRSLKRNPLGNWTPTERWGLD